MCDVGRSVCQPEQLSEVPVRASSRAGGRSLSYVFTKGGAETTKLMNVINIPMQTSAVVRKMAAGPAAPAALGNEQGDNNGSGPSSSSKSMTPKDISLIVKKELSVVKTLKIELKDKERKMLGEGVDIRHHLQVCKCV